MYTTLSAVLLVGTRAQTNVGPCADLDTAACELMSKQRDDLCSDPSLANSACPKYCNLCPLQCYHCDAAVNDLHLCNTTKTCNTGEVCMRKELKSYVDGHHKYHFTCEPKQHCDGTSLNVTFGKRHVESRDLVISCCGNDLCNLPHSTTAMPTTTTSQPTTTYKYSACRKDVIVMVDDGHASNEDGHSIQSFLLGLVKTMKISPNEVLMSVVKYSKEAEKQWDLQSYTNNTDLSNAIQMTGFLHSSRQYDYLDTALSYLVHNGKSSDNRPHADDVVIILAAHGSYGTSATSFSSRALYQLQSEYSNVIVIGYHHVPHNELVELATDSHHVLDIRHASNLDSVVDRVASLICGQTTLGHTDWWNYHRHTTVPNRLFIDLLG